MANVSHELRTPLTGIRAAAQNIFDGVVQSPGKTSRYAKAILQQEKCLSELVEQILMFSAVEKDRHNYHFQPTSVSQLIQAALARTEGIWKQAGVAVDVRVASDLPLVNVDGKAMEQCLQNLITNAVKYGGGHRWMGIYANVRRVNGTKEVRIAVLDKGIGISPEESKLIFDPFYRAPQVSAAQIHGTGIGLSLAKTIAEAMGGTLTVDSKWRKRFHDTSARYE